MSEHTTTRAVVQAIYEAFEAGDLPALRRLLAADLRWRQAGAAVPAAGTQMIGAEHLIDEVIRPLSDEWEGFTQEIQQIIACDEHAVVTGTYRGTYPRTRASLAAEFCHLWTVEGGQAQTFRQYTDTAAFADAQAGAGGDRA